MPNASQPDTRQRLLDAAGAVFAECGFRAACVREICRRAGANGAAVNYHFGGKAKLHQAVLHDAHAQAIRKYPPDLGLTPSARPQERLHAFIRSFLLRLLDTRRPAWYGQLMSRELADPTATLDELVGKFFRPMFLELLKILRPLLGGASRRQSHHAAASVVAQCLFYYHNVAVINRLDPRQTYRPGDIEQLADHITRFSLGGLRALAESKDRPTARKTARRPKPGASRKELP
jgi:AcrR family transcriptional regulator